MTDQLGTAQHDTLPRAVFHDAAAIAAAIGEYEAGSVLQVGTGSGEILYRLASSRPDVELIGVDPAEIMLNLAALRLRKDHPYVSLLLREPRTLHLHRLFDLIFTYDGPLYVMRDLAGEHTLVSRVGDAVATGQLLRRLAAHLPAGGQLLLGVQGPPRPYNTDVGGGLRCLRQIAHAINRFRTEDHLLEGERAMWTQTTEHWTWPMPVALDLLSQAKLHPLPARSSLFMGFQR